MDKNFYITTTLPYVNSEPHVGHALEFIRADIIARSKKLQGYNVFFNTGTDEHGQKLFNAAKDAGLDVKDYVDKHADVFKKLPKELGLLEDIHFIRTTDPHHEKAAQEFWKRCFSFQKKGSFLLLVVPGASRRRFIKGPIIKCLCQR